MLKGMNDNKKTLKKELFNTQKKTILLFLVQSNFSFLMKKQIEGKE